MFPGLLKISGPRSGGLRRHASKLPSVLRQFIYVYHLAALVGLSPIVWNTLQVAHLSVMIVEIAAKEQDAQQPTVPVGEAGWNERYVFNPSPTFWKPLDSLPVSSFPPYYMGHHLKPPNRLIFASCNRQPEGLDAKKDAEGRRVWSHISRRKPQAFLWMGDNVYADHMQLPTAADSRNLLWKISDGKKPIPPPGLVAAYNSQIANKEYRNFLAGVPGVAGTWDDHDMGEDNANKLYSYKDESKEAMLDFLGVDGSAAIRSLDWRGVYSSHQVYFGEDLQVKIIFLDLRFEKDSWWLMDRGDMLGEQQWKWLQQELQLSTADVNVVISSLQVFANHRLVTETWSHFPWARERLFALLAGSGAKTPILLSGDTHYAEFAAVHCQRLPEAWCLDEPLARSYLSLSHNRSTGSLTPHQQLRRLSNSEGDDLVSEQQRRNGGGHRSDTCDPSEQCCGSPITRSALFWWIPRHLPFFLLTLFRVATDPEVFTPRQLWRRKRAPAFYGAFPPPPFEPDQCQESFLPEEDTSSTYLFDLTSSGLGHGVPESLCRSASAVVELVVHFLTEVVPFGSSLNADITGPRLLYTERNFGELEFIENPLQLLLFPSGVNRSISLDERLALLERLLEGDASSRAQLLSVREKHAALQERHKQQTFRSSLQADRMLTKELTAEFRSRLGAYKEHRQRLVKQLRAKPELRVAVVERLSALSEGFEAYVQATLGVNGVLFERLLQLHSALLLTHACDDEDATYVGDKLTRRNPMMFGTCNLLAPWAPPSHLKPSDSLVDAVLWWLGDLVFGLTVHREARSSSLPMADGATLRLSAAIDTLVRKSARVRVATISAAAMGERRYEVLVGFRRRGRRGPRRLLDRPLVATHSRRTLRQVLAAASDGLVRQACFQLRSPRREQQREGMQQLFRRGVANQPADALDFAQLDSDLKVVCSLVEILPMPEGSRAPSAYSGTPETVTSCGEGAARAVATSGVIVEMLETKAWILSRTFDVVTGRLVKEKLLSSFASEQQQRQPGIGQWVCQGWKGPTEGQLYLCHLCILLVTLIFLGGVGLVIIVVLRNAVMETALPLVLWVQSWCRGHRRASYVNNPSSSQKQSAKDPQRQQLMRKGTAVAGAVVAVGLAAAVLLWMDNSRLST